MSALILEHLTQSYFTTSILYVYHHPLVWNVSLGTWLCHLLQGLASLGQALAPSKAPRDLGCNRSCINKVSWFMIHLPYSFLCRKRMRSTASRKLWQSRFSWSEPLTEDKGCPSKPLIHIFLFQHGASVFAVVAFSHFTFFLVAPLWRNRCFWFLHHSDWGSAHTQEESIIASWCKGDSTKHVSLATAKDTPSRLGYKFNVSINSTDH